MPSPERPRVVPKNLGDLKYWVYRIFNQRDSVNVEIQDQHSEVIDLLLSELIDDVTIITDTLIDDTDIDIETTGSVPAVGNLVCFKEQTAFYQGFILAVTPIAGNQYTITMDTPLDYAYTTAGGCSTRNANIAVDGSVTPRVFAVSNDGLTVDWDITRMSMIMLGSGPVADPEPDDTRFGTTLPLTKGVVFRSVNGVHKNIFNAKTNADIKLHCGGDLSYQPSNKNGEYSVDARRTFNGQEKNGVTMRLIAADEDQFQIIVQDNLSGMSTFYVNVQGHVVEI